MHVRLYATLRDLLGAARLEQPLPDPATVGQALQRLAADYPALADKLWDGEGNLTGYVTVLLNGRSIEYLRGSETPLCADDTLSLFPPVGGG